MSTTTKKKKKGHQDGSVIKDLPIKPNFLIIINGKKTISHTTLFSHIDDKFLVIS